MWDVVRFAEQMHYDAIVVENVVEATKWILWGAWLKAMTDLGYEHQILSHNSMHHGVPQSRDRIYVVWWKKGLTPVLEMEQSAWCSRCDCVRQVRQAWKNGRSVGRYRQQWIWTCTECRSPCDPSTEPASGIIDWELDCPRIGDRPLEGAEEPLPNVWLGTSIESDQFVWRADHLRETNAAVRFLSLEPLLGPLPRLDYRGIGWVIVGGESGPKARPMAPSWARDIRDACQRLGVPFLFKQWGEWSPDFNMATMRQVDESASRLGKKAAGRDLDGRTWGRGPEPHRIPRPSRRRDPPLRRSDGEGRRGAAIPGRRSCPATGVVMT
jgi:hypothetical protein